MASRAARPHHVPGRRPATATSPSAAPSRARPSAAGAAGSPPSTGSTSARCHQRGRYRIRTQGAVRTVSPWFEVTSARALFAPMIDHGVAFDQNQRDGDELVAGPLDRQPSHLNDAPGRRLRMAAHGPRRGRHHRPGPHQDRRTGRRRGRLGRCRRLPQVHPLVGVQRRRPLHQRPAPRRAGAREPARRGAPRPGVAGQDVGRADRHPAHPGRHRLGQQAGHLRRRPRPVAAAAGRRPRHRPDAPLRRAPAGLRRRARRPADQPQPRRPGVGGVRPRRPARRGDRPGEGPSELHEAQALYARADTATPAAAAGHRAPPRLLPGVGLAGRHGARRRRDRPRRAAARRARHGLPRRRRALGQALPAGRLHRHPQPVRRRRAGAREPRRRDARGAARPARGHPRAAGRTTSADQVRQGLDARAARPVRRGRRRHRVRRQLAHLRPGRHGRPLSTG